MIIIIPLVQPQARAEFEKIFGLSWDDALSRGLSCIYIYVYIYIHMYLSLSIYIYIYICVYVYIHNMYTYISLSIYR